MRARNPVVCWPRACRLSNDSPRPKSSSQEATSSHMMAAMPSTSARTSSRGSASLMRVWPIRRQSCRTRPGEVRFIMQNIVPMTRPALELRTGQPETLTRQLRQSARVLRLATLDLRAEIAEALAENPMRERADEPAEPEAASDREEAVADGPWNEAGPRSEEMPGSGGV